MSQKMKEVVTEILKKWDLLEAFENASGGRFHLKIKNPPYMDLVIEKIQSNEISIAHYGEMNGDAMRDPEVVFRLPDWIPLYIQQDYLGVNRETHDENGNPISSEVASVNRFCDQTWAPNLLHQKFNSPPRCAAESSTHAYLLSLLASPDAHLEIQYEERSRVDD